MARSPRKLGSSKVYHIVIRGTKDNKIFEEESDKEQILAIVSKVLGENLIGLYAYCVLDDHAHFIVEELQENISNAMKRINVAYALYYNKKHHKKGQVFYDRFKSECINDPKVLLKVIRYVHKNPIQSGYVLRLTEYKWSSYLEYIDRLERNLVEKERVFSLFESKKSPPTEAFVRFMRSDTGDEQFMDIQGSIEMQMKKQVRAYLEKNHIKLEQLGYKENTIHRNYLIKYLRQKGHYSIRKIADTLAINRGTVYNVVLDFERGS
ncbi:MAG TPA: hypothetical protein DHN33_07650 [Eubacteriaceae bacterium]|nr:hypothetical protein [Eubacteriaceae bacterium]